MRVSHPGVLPIALLALVVAACAPTNSTSGAPTEPETNFPSENSPNALLGSYSVEYRTTESDRDTITDEVIVRNVEITGSCSGAQCDLAFTTELKAPDGSATSGTTALTFEGTEYRGTQATTFSCDGMRTLTTVEDGLEYTSETTITPTATIVEEGRTVVTAFDIVIVDRNEITTAGRDAGCLEINLSGPDPYVSNSTAVGEGTRQP